MPPHRSNAGMTLMEVLAVVVILSLLAVTLVVALGGRIGAAKQEIATLQISRLRDGIETYKAMQSRFPDNLDALAVPDKSFSVEPANLQDPWGRKWQLLIPGPGGQPQHLRSRRPRRAGSRASCRAPSCGWRCRPRRR